MTRGLPGAREVSRVNRRIAAALDRAAWDAYGWPADEVPAEVEEDVILSSLLALNTEQASG